MEATLELSEHKQKFGKVVSSGPQCMKTPENLFEGAEDASCMEASLLAIRVENGTGKSRPDRLRLPFKPTVNRFREKNRKMGKQNGKTGGNGNGNGWGVFPTVFTVLVFSRENSRGNSRICRSRLCYLCWKRELLFACVPT